MPRFPNPPDTTPEEIADLTNKKGWTNIQDKASATAESIINALISRGKTNFADPEDETPENIGVDLEEHRPTTALRAWRAWGSG